MFPNVRLMLAAIAASMIVLSCGFGLFAAFRVSHEPLARIPVTSSPLQFAANSPGLAGWAAAAVPVSAQPTMIQTELTDAGADAVLDADTADNDEPATSMSPATPIVVREASAEAAADGASAEFAPSPTASSVDTSSKPAPAGLGSSDVPSPQTATSAPATPQPEPLPPTADASMPAQHAHSTEASAARAPDTANAAKQSESSPEAAQPGSDNDIAGTPAATSIIAAVAQPPRQDPQIDADALAAPAPSTERLHQSQAEATPSTAEIASSTSTTSAAEKPPASVAPKTRAKVSAKAAHKVVRRAEPKHHATARRVARRAQPVPLPAPASFQAVAFPQSNFQSAPQQTYFVPQPAAEPADGRRRLVQKIGGRPPGASRMNDQAAVGGPFRSRPQ
jgi:hypothetical protein